MRKISADWLFTLNQDPIEKGVLICTDDGTIEDILMNRDGVAEIEILDGFLCPGFVNSHCHLELSYLKNQIPTGGGLVSFIQHLQKIRNEITMDKDDAILEGENEMIANGIVAVGDICNGATTFNQKRLNRLQYHSFIEVFGFNPTQANTHFSAAQDLLNLAPQSANITPHAPYSVSEELFRLIQSPMISIHNQESEAENQFFEKKTGDFVSLYDSFGIDIGFWKPSGKTSIQTYLPYFSAIKRMFVHNTFTSEMDIEFVENLGECNYWCLCPNANLFIEKTLPNVILMANMNLQICIGTDSLASNHSLCVLSELKTLKKYFPEITTNQLFTWACKNGASFFGWENLGTLEKGKRPGINHIKNTLADNITKNSCVKPLRFKRN